MSISSQGTKEPGKTMRQESLDPLSDPEQLDSLLVVVTPKAWAALICLIGIILAVILWTIFGSIPIKVQGKGIVMNQKGQLFTVEAALGGTVARLYVKAGDEIKKGDIIAQISNSEEELKVTQARIKTENLNRDLARLKSDVAKEEKAHIEALQRDKAAKQYNLEQLTDRVKALESDYTKKKALYDEGIISLIALRDAEEKLTNTRIEIETTKAAIANIEYDLAKGYRTEEIKQKEKDLLQQNEDQELLESRLPYYKTNSPSDGTVLAVLVSEGDLVQPGTPLVWMEYRTEEFAPYVIYGYFPVEKGKRILKGTKVQIGLSTVDPQEYGYMTGTVSDVSEFAVSKESISRTIHNKELVEYLTSGDKAVIQVMVEPDIDPKTHEYHWTSNKVPPVKITTGTVCTLQAIIHRIRPIYYILPLEVFQIIPEHKEHT
jgi:HlyD family secretion protein